MKNKLFLFSVLFFLIPLSAPAEIELPNFPFVKSSNSGMYYVKSVPSEIFGQKGKTYLFRVEHGADALIGTYDWYSNDIFIGGREQNTIVRFGPRQQGNKPEKDHLAIGIYRDSKTIHEYSTLDMYNLGSGYSRSLGHYSVFVKTLGFRQLNREYLNDEKKLHADFDSWEKENRYLFEVKVSSGKIFSFDLETGKIIKTSDEEAPAEKVK